jgi:hypothetical protein
MNEEEKIDGNLERKEINVFILTPYLTEQLEGSNGDYDAFKQMIHFKYDPNNFSGVRELRTDNKVVRLESLKCNRFRRGLVQIAPTNFDLVISGNTEATEEEVRGFMGSGLVVGRYSIFCGGPSGYTGRRPEESGYALDIPKDVFTVRELLTNGDFLEGLVLRDGEMIRSAISDLNGSLREPILVTPYLDIALGESMENYLADYFM